MNMHWMTEALLSVGCKCKWFSS